MLKVIDLDGLFDKYIEKYVYENIGKVKPEEIENKIPLLYTEFGDKPCKELDGKSPNTYYKGYSAEELLSCLKSHLNEGVSVSDFLCEAVGEKKDGEKTIVSEILKDGDSEEYTAYLMNFLNDVGGEIPTQKYLELALWGESEALGELATEFLAEKAELVKEKVLDVYKDSVGVGRARLTEILSNTKNDDRVFDILIEEFVKNTDNIPLYAGYLSKFGDVRALPFLTTAIEGDKINYADFEELRFAIEALGGSYDKKRDFSADKTYKKIKGVKKSNK